MKTKQWLLWAFFFLAAGCGSSEFSSRSSDDSQNSFSLESSPTSVRAVALRSDSHCAVLMNGEIQCWGDNNRWQLGFSGPTVVSRPGTPVKDTLATHISPSGEYHHCVASEGQARCWGFSQQGELGNGAVPGQPHLPRTVARTTGVVSQVANSSNFSCALNTAGAVQCWGGNSNLSGIPRTPPGLGERVTSLAGDFGSMCAIRRTADNSSAEVLCFGHNPGGQLGDGTTISRDTPATTLPFESGHPVSLAVSSARACAVSNLGDVYCWGANFFGSLLGTAAPGDNLLQPTRVPNLPERMVEVSVGSQHVCARSETQNMYCWGFNSKGQLQGFLNPVQHRVFGPTLMKKSATVPLKVLQVAAGHRTTCAIDENRALWCWGTQDAGVLGNGATSGSTATPVQIVFSSDRGGILDGGTPETDAGTEDAGVDGGEENDGGIEDAGVDAGVSDAGTPDAGCVDEEIQTVSAIHPRRSLFVTDVAILEGAFGQPSPFRFERLMNQLVAQANVPGLTAQALYNQWWDTQNPFPGINQGAHCNDSFVNGVPGFNGFPWQCPRGEGALVNTNPFNPNGTDGYRPIALVNRFDLTMASGAHCGEYRIVYGKNGSRNLIIFEAQMPNPTPARGAQGCFPLVKFWLDLSTKNPSAPDMQRALEEFYFTGIQGFPPAVHINHYALGQGQIRTNQFMDTFSGWTLKEFQLRLNCNGTACLKFEPRPVDNNPYPPLFVEAHPRASAFRSHFVSQVDTLAAGDLNRFGMKTDATFNTGASMSQGVFNNTNSVLTLNNPANTYLPFAQLNAGGSNSLTFQAIRSRLPTNSNLSVEHILNRATVSSCGGCHQHGNGVAVAPGQLWPSSLGFVHVEETASPNAGGVFGNAFPISPALQNLFLPFRREVLVGFYNARRCGPPLVGPGFSVPEGNIGGTLFGH